MSSANASISIATAICVHDDYWFLEHAIKSVVKACPCYVFVSRQPWALAPGESQRRVNISKDIEATVVLG